MLSRLSFKSRVLLLVGATIAGLTLQSVMTAVTTRNHIVEGRKAALRSVVQSARAIAVGYQAAAAAGKMTDEAARNAAAEAMRQVRYGGADGRAN